MSRSIAISKEAQIKLCKLVGKEQTHGITIDEVIQTREAVKQSSVGFTEPTKQESV